MALFSDVMKNESSYAGLADISHPGNSHQVIPGNSQTGKY